MKVQKHCGFDFETIRSEGNCRRYILRLPCRDCRGLQPQMHWYALKNEICGVCPTGLSKNVIFRRFPDERRGKRHGKHILTKIRYRDKLYSKIIKCKHSNPNLIYLQKKFRNSVVKDVKTSKSDYLKNYFLCNRNNMKKIWSGIRSIINSSKVKADYIPSILESGKTVDNPCTIANMSNNSLLMWVKTLAKTFRVGTVVQPLF